ncbi:MAG TPA: sulfotransferase [Terriglobales bacterium]|nr:sulfotransferase [Terriglobales bacterium]
MVGPNNNGIAKPAKPVFVVGSPRSGTSILTWCLGHHPNLFPVPESSWMGDFSLNVAIAYQIGAARGEYSILSAMDIPNDEFFAAFGRTINGLIMHHREDLEQKREAKCVELQLDRRWLEASSSAAGPKTRWVDGTPEYSLHICGLRKLFPDALFVHVVRDALAVVRSMVNFHRATGIQLVRDVEEAYHYWTRTVKACLMAERAYGPAVVHRVHYADLIDNRESTVRSLLKFLQEPYSDRCLAPLDIRINSSSVPLDFQISEAVINPEIATEARLVSDEIQRSAQPAEPSSAAADAIEAAFRGRIAAVVNRGNAHRSNPPVAEGLHNSAVGSDPATEAATPVTGPSMDISSLQP